MSAVQDEAYILDRSFFCAVVPLSPKKKKPYAHDWQKRSFNKSDFKPDDNIGIKTGEPSGWLVDVDLDDPIALQLADQYLPRTDAVTGRPSAPRSHRWYLCPNAKTRQWQLTGHGMIVELRSTGCQTVVGPSIHPESEQYEKLRGKPAEVDADTLVAAIDALFQAVCKHYGVEPAVKPTAAQPAPEQSAAQPAPASWNQPSPQPALPAMSASRASVGQSEVDLERRAIAYMDRCPPAISGQGGHAQTFTVTQALIYGFGLSDDTAFRLLAQYYSPRCEPPWSESELRHKVDSARKHPCDKPAGWLLNDDAYARDDTSKVAIDVASLLSNSSHQQAEARETGGERQAPCKIVYTAWTGAELMMKTDLEPQYLVDGVLVAGQPCIVSAPKKALKTSTIVDGAISLATGGYFLGVFKVFRPATVGLMTGESGLGVIQETIRRICKIAGVNPCTLDRLFITDQIPQLEDPAHLQALEALIAKHALEVLIVDPVYLAMSGADAGNLFKQGKALRGIAEICAAHGVTLILVHHTKKNTADPFGIPELEDIAWAGFQEFARQWILLGRRERYIPGTGEHRLWLVVGGSAGHSGAWGLDVEEGCREDEGGRVWKTTVRPANEIYAAGKELRNQTKALAERAARDDRCKRVWDWLCSQPGGATKSRIRDATGINADRVAEAIEMLLESCSVEPCEVVVSNGRKCAGYRGVRASIDKPEQQGSLFG